MVRASGLCAGSPVDARRYADRIARQGNAQQFGEKTRNKCPISNKLVQVWHAGRLQIGRTDPAADEAGGYSVPLIAWRPRASNRYSQLAAALVGNQGFQTLRSGGIAGFKPSGFGRIQYDTAFSPRYHRSTGSGFVFALWHAVVLEWG